VLDIMLPLMNGYDVLKYMRAQKVWSPVLMLTAKDGEYDQTDAFELGADDYVTKPFSTPCCWPASRRWLAGSPRSGRSRSPSVA
jgi:DNA-binding response OmpR family regulator